MTISEAERQLLIALIELEEPFETPNNNFYNFYPKTLEDAATYFRGLRQDWTSAYPSLAERGLLDKPTSAACLTASGKELARRERLAHPPIWYWYREFYPRAARSAVYARFCEQVYGKNLYQAGFSDMPQIDFLISAGNLSAKSAILDLGCGLGGVIEHLSDATGACATGMDYVQEAVQLAQERTRSKRYRLDFLESNLDELNNLSASFDTLLSIDTLYMPGDLPATLRKMCSLLQPSGQILIYYSTFVPDSTTSRSQLSPSGNPLGLALGQLGLPYSTWDFTQSTFDLMRRKRRVANEMRQAFDDQGEQMLFDFLYAESDGGGSPFDPATCNMSRYLYRVVFC